MDGHGWVKDTITNESRFVGFKIRTRGYNSLTNIIHSVGLQTDFDPANLVSPLELYVYHSKMIDPIAKLELAGGNKIQWNWTDEGVELKSWNDEWDGGVFIIGYYQDDISSDGQAINNKKFNWLKGPCGTCNTKHNLIIDWKKIRKTMDIMPIYVPAGSINVDRTMFDIEDCVDKSDTNWGLNFKMTSSCRYDYFFCQNKSIVREAIGLKVAHELLKYIRYTNRINYVEESIRNMMAIDIEGAPKTALQGQEYLPLADRLRQAIDGIHFDMSGIDNICLDCTDESTPVSYEVM